MSLRWAEVKNQTIWADGKVEMVWEKKPFEEQPLCIGPHRTLDPGPPPSSQAGFLLSKQSAKACKLRLAGPRGIQASTSATLLWASNLACVICKMLLQGTPRQAQFTAIVLMGYPMEIKPEMGLRKRSLWEKGLSCSGDGVRWSCGFLYFMCVASLLPLFYP